MGLLLSPRGPWDTTLVVRRGGQRLSLLSHLASPTYTSFPALQFSVSERDLPFMSAALGLEPPAPLLLRRLSAAELCP